MVQQPQRNAPGPLQGGGAFTNLDVPSLSDTKLCNHAQVPSSEQDLHEKPFTVNGARRPDAAAPIDAVAQGMQPPPGFSFPNLQVKNTFLQIEEIGDGDTTQHIPFRQRSHLRCASEPLWGASAMSPRWELRTPSPSDEPMFLKQCFSEADDGNASLHDASAAPFNLSASPRLGLPVGIGEGASEDGSSGKGSVSSSSLQPGFLRARHSRQCSKQTVCTIEEGIGSNGSDDTVEHHEKDAMLIGRAPCASSSAPSHQLSGGQYILGLPANMNASVIVAQADATSKNPETISLQEVLMNLSPRVRDAPDAETFRSEGSGNLSSAVGERPARRHLQQWSIQTAATNDEFENNMQSLDLQEQSAGSDAAACNPYHPLLGCMPDPRAADPWSAQKAAAAAAAASRKLLANAMNEATVGLHSTGSSGPAPGKDQAVAPPLPLRLSGAPQEIWQQCSHEFTKFPVQPPYAALMQVPAQLASRMPAGGLPPGPVGPLAGFTHPDASMGGSLRVPSVLPTVGAKVLSGWNLHRPPFPIYAQTAAERKPVHSEADATAAAYAQGVAAGAASAASAEAFAKGFAAGVAATTAAGHRSGLESTMSVSAYTAPAMQNLQVRTPTKAERSGSKKSAQDVPLCKWFAKGSCKFGDGCRYRHQLMVHRPDALTTHVTPCASNAHPRPLTGSVSAPHVSSVGAFQDHSGSLAGIPSSGNCQTVDSEVLKTLSLNDAVAPDDEAPLTAEFQIFWCDQRAFKDSAAPLKMELATQSGVPVKTYRTADMCMRLLRKKRHWQGKDVARLFLVSWANAQVLVPYLNESQHIAAKVIVLCDTCGTRGCNKAEAWVQQFPFVIAVASTWPQAVSALREAVLTQRQV
mmetsp:Transcript_4291/g.8361  ORF Transcript_4291/g.8361 Transcript_4291/m.8361 type:complete len:863 (-) Transcript_4291:98-2686(-)